MDESRSAGFGHMLFKERVCDEDGDGVCKDAETDCGDVLASGGGLSAVRSPGTVRIWGMEHGCCTAGGE